MTGIIFDIQRFCTHDGPGIRTTAFLKGCSLNCAWCHNPEGIKPMPEIRFDQSKCINCKRCINICPKGCFSEHGFNNENCNMCKECVKNCPSGAITVCGKEMSTEELCKILLEDKPFYEASKGGITLSGGECILQKDFCIEVLKEMRKNNIHTAIETAGNVPKEDLLEVLSYADLVLYDIKCASDELHEKLTGAGNKRILENLYAITSLPIHIAVRVPIIPSFNAIEEEMRKINEILKPIRQRLDYVEALKPNPAAFAKDKSIGIQRQGNFQISKENFEKLEKIILN